MLCVHLANQSIWTIVVLIFGMMFMAVLCVHCSRCVVNVYCSLNWLVFHAMAESEECEVINFWRNVLQNKYIVQLFLHSTYPYFDIYIIWPLILSTFSVFDLFFCRPFIFRRFHSFDHFRIRSFIFRHFYSTFVIRC